MRAPRFNFRLSTFTLERLIAVRYLFSRKQRSVVNVISWISLVGLMVSTMALIVVLSVYNGIGDVTKSLFNTFDPELVIEPAEGRTFHTSDIDMGALTRTEGVERVARIVTETAWVTYGQNQAIVKLRGVDTNYAALTGIDTLLALGEYRLTAEGTTTLVVGGQIFHDLAMRLPSAIPAAVHIPKRGTTSLGLTMDQAFNIGYAYPVGNFFIQQDIDRQYVLTDIAFVQRLMNYAPDECTSLALKLAPGADVEKVRDRVAESLSGRVSGRVTESLSGKVATQSNNSATQPLSHSSKSPQPLFDNLFHRHRAAVGILPVARREQFLHGRLGKAQHRQCRLRLLECPCPFAARHAPFTTHHAAHLVGQLEHNPLGRLGADAFHALHLLHILRLDGLAQLVHRQRRQHHPRRLVAHAVHTHQYAEHFALRHVVEPEQLLCILPHHVVGVELHLLALRAPQRLIGIQRDFQQISHSSAIHHSLCRLQRGQSPLKVFVHIRSVFSILNFQFSIPSGNWYPIPSAGEPSWRV